MRMAARGPRGGAVARGPRGAVARGPPRRGRRPRALRRRRRTRAARGNVAVRGGYRPGCGSGRLVPAEPHTGGARAERLRPAQRSASCQPPAAASYAGRPPAPGYCWYYTQCPALPGLLGRLPVSRSDWLEVSASSLQRGRWGAFLGCRKALSTCDRLRVERPPVTLGPLDGLLNPCRHSVNET